MEVRDLLGLAFSGPLILAVLLAAVHLLIVVFVDWRRGTKVRKGILGAIIVGAFVWLVIAARMAGTVEKETRTPIGIADAPYSTCSVFGFPDAQSFADASVKDPSIDELGRLPQDPPGCIDKLRRWMKSDPPALINVYGRADRRALSRAARERVVSNEALAHQRATTVAKWIATSPDPLSNEATARTELLIARTHVDVAGVRYTNTKVAQALEQDRSVDVEAFWPREDRFNSPAATVRAVENRRALVGVRLNDEGMDPGVALAVLSLFVALSAYLATVGFFMRGRVTELKAEIGAVVVKIHEVKAAIAYANHQQNLQAVAEHQAIEKLLGSEVNVLTDKKDETGRHLSLLPIADLPMIAAALVLALHLFFFISTAWLRASIVFATFAAMILIVQHAVVWLKTLMRLFK